MKADVKATVGSSVFENSPNGTGVVSFEVKSTWEYLTDVCTIDVPRKFNWLGKTVAKGEALFKRGDKVELKAGYDGKLNTVFIGYIRDIFPNDAVIKFVCEDEMFLLKKGSITKSYEKVNLKQLLTEVLPTGTKFDAVNIDLGKLRIKQATPAQVLDMLRKDYGLNSFFREGKLYVGLAYWDKGKSIRYEVWNGNVLSEGIDNLRFQKEEDVKIKIVAISLNENNTKTQVEVGDSDGETRTLHYYNLSEKDLKKIANEQLPKFKFTGYVGSFKSFFEPFPRHGDVAIIKDSQNPDRNGNFSIKQVDYTFGMGEEEGLLTEIFIDNAKTT